LVVDTQFVNEKIGNPDWVILDARDSEKYRNGHIPGAINFVKIPAIVLRDPTHRAYTIVPTIEKRIGDFGISNDKHIIVYGGAVNAYYVTVPFWIFEYLGCNSSNLKCTVHYYDGGFERWLHEKDKSEEKETVLPPTLFKSRVIPSRLATTEEVLQVVKGVEKAILIDTRTEAEYNGSDIRSLRGGYIPGAINIKVQKNYDNEAYRMLSLPELQILYQDMPKNARIITYCQTGTRSTYTYLVLRLLGYDNVASYNDSWGVYGSNVNYPAANEQWFDFTEMNDAVKTIRKLESH
jgi:thiosulfate/3-mercaptopyruvate sulfurtransferase